MKKIFISTIVAVFLLMAGTVMAMGRPSGGSVSVPIPVLPHLVVMEEEPYYYNQGYYYQYRDDRWFYSQSRRGPWSDLPRSHYAKEVKYKKEHWKYDEGRNQYHREDDQGRDQGNDNRSDDQWNNDRGHNQSNDNRENDNRGNDQRNDNQRH